jgi:thioredoxin 1
MFGPVLEAASQRHIDVTFAKVDTEAERAFAAAAQIRSSPTLMAFRDGILVFSQPGALVAAAFAQVIGAVRNLDMADVRRSSRPSNTLGRYRDLIAVSTARSPRRG